MKWMRVAAVIGMSVPLPVLAQTPRTTSLNRTVIVRPGGATTVSPECAEGLAPQPQPRVTEQERTIVIPPAPAMEAPPSADLRSTLVAAVEAAQNNDRATFDDRLTRATQMLASYPPGGERNAASDVVAVLNDVHTVWAYEFSSSTGAFFDASSDLYRMLAKYPGYDAAVRRQVLVDQNGARFYPSRESRDFLASEAATRLSRLTGRAIVKTPAPKVARQPEAHPAPAPAPKVAEQHKKPAGQHRVVVHKKHVTHKQPVTKVAEAAPAPKPKPKPKVAPATTSTTAPVPTSTHATTTTAPPPVTASTSTATSTSMTESAPPPTATATTESQATPQQQPATSHSNLIVPIILIILGVGVLVLFSRSSSA